MVTWPWTNKMGVCLSCASTEYLLQCFDIHKMASTVKVVIDDVYNVSQISVLVSCWSGQQKWHSTLNMVLRESQEASLDASRDPDKPIKKITNKMAVCLWNYICSNHITRWPIFVPYEAGIIIRQPVPKCTLQSYNTMKYKLHCSLDSFFYDIHTVIHLR